MDKTVEYYLGLPYTIELIAEPAGGWFVAVKELPGCMSEGDTPEEAIQMIRDAMCGWIEISLADGDPIPEPRELDDYSGKFVVRVPRTLHRQLVEASADEGVSLNQLVNVLLAQGVSQPAPARRAAPPAPRRTRLRSVTGLRSATAPARESAAIREEKAAYLSAEDEPGADEVNARSDEPPAQNAG